MAKGQHIKLMEQGVVTQEALLAYIEGRLVESERVQLEAMLVDEPFLNDAIEGLRASNATTSKTAVSALKGKVREKSGVREKKETASFQWVAYAYAALIFGILIGVGYLIVIYLHDNPTQTAENTPAIVAQPDTLLMTKATVKDTLSVSAKDTHALTPTIALPMIDTTHAFGGQTTISPKPETLSNRSTLTMTATAPEAGAASGAMMVTTPSTTPIANTMDTRTKMAKTETKIAEDAQKKDALSIMDKSSEISNRMLAAKTTFESNDFINAAKRYDDILSDQPNNADALYYSGVCSYINGNNAKAEQRFDKLLQRGLYNDGAKWYKANLLMRRGQVEQGMQLLYELSRTNGYFKDRALKKYQEMHH